jgi:dUTP pyrophosphatase
MLINFVKLHPNAKVPTQGSDKAAGFDLHALLSQERISIPPHETVKIGTGLAIQPPAGYFGAIFARSGLATKSGLRPANCVGVCDQDYTGEYIVALHNDTDEMKFVENGDRIAQLAFIPYLSAQFVEVESLDETARGDGGFGSSGK